MGAVLHVPYAYVIIALRLRAYLSREAEHQILRNRAPAQPRQSEGLGRQLDVLMCTLCVCPAVVSRSVLVADHMQGARA